MKQKKLSTLWPYKHEDKTTWKYIDFENGVRVINGRDILYVKKWIKNPDFAYAKYDRLGE